VIRQYRFQAIVDPEDGKELFTIEHEVRSMKHPLYLGPLVNRNPPQSIMQTRLVRAARGRASVLQPRVFCEEGEFWTVG